MADYVLFKEAFNLIQNKEHLTPEGLKKIIAIKASLNLGLGDELKTAFPDITPNKRPLISGEKVKDKDWLAGFTSGEGCFYVSIKKSKSSRIGFQVLLFFEISQHSRDKQLLVSIIDFFGCGKIYKKNKEVYAYRVVKFSDLTEKVIPFFKNYPIIGVKS